MKKQVNGLYKDQFSPVLKALKKELEYFHGRVRLGFPQGVVTGNDLVLLEKWTPEDLLGLARKGGFQVALYETGKLDPQLEPFYDWQIDSPYELDYLKNLASPMEVSAPMSTSVGDQSALFLDRDGVVNVDHGYVGSPSQVQLTPSISELIRSASQQRKKVIIVTNQSGVGRGYYSQQDFDRVTNHLLDLLRKENAFIDHTEAAFFHPKAEEGEYRRGRQRRKPRPGMIHHNVWRFNLQLKESLLVGDRATDVMAGALAGVGKIYLLSSNYCLEELTKFEKWIFDLENKFGLKILQTPHGDISFRILDSLAHLGEGDFGSL